MGVCDITTLGQTAVPVYNTNASVTQSVQVKDAWSKARGIPSANAFGRDWGSAVVRAYDSEAAIYTLIDELATHCTSVGATGCYPVAGCPVAIELLTADGTDAGTDGGLAFDFMHLCANAKAIQALGYLPRLVDDTEGGVFLVKKFPPSSWSGYQNFFEAFGARVTAHPTALEFYNDATYDAAIAAAGAGYGSGVTNQFIRYLSTFAQSGFSGLTRLLGGWVGYYTHEDASHPTFDQSRIILGRAANSEGKLASLSARKVLSGTNVVGSGTSDIGKAARNAMMARACDDAGLQVTYWTPDGSDAAANYLMPWAGTHANWSVATLNDNTATGTQTPDLVMGWDFQNITPSDWESHIIPTVNGIFIGGRSGNGKWGKWMQGFGHSAIIQQIEVGGTHAGTATSISRQADALLLLLDGKTLAEAAWVSQGGTLMAIGDPLARPFQ
jgi:hypothetical protein